MANADLDFDVLSWHEAFIVEKVRIYGTLADGTTIDHTHTFGETEEVDVIGVRRMVTDMNNGTYRI